MKRYNITAEPIPGNDTWAEDARIKITEAGNGEWVRYEDDALAQRDAFRAGMVATMQKILREAPVSLTPWNSNDEFLMETEFSKYKRGLL